MNRMIALWKETAPYTAESPEQAQPSLKEYAVPGSRGAVVVIPGGGYEMKASDHEGDQIARMLNEAGISAYVLDYRVKPCHYLAPLTDASRAIRMVRSFGFEKVGVLGFSAGGNLCCNAATHYDAGNPESEDPIERFSSRPDVFLPCYAVVSLCQYTHVGSRQALLGSKSDDLKLVRFFSAEQNVTPDTPPAFIWHTSEDDCVPVENSLLLAAALAQNGIPFALHVYPHGHHGLGLAPEMPDVQGWAGLAQRWLIDQGFGK